MSEARAIANKARSDAWRRGLRQWWAALPWLLPTLVGLVLFTAGATIAALMLSFTRWDMLNPPKWIGLRNYVYFLTDHPLFWRVLGNTFYYTALAVPLGVAIPFLVAVAMNQKLRGITVFRTVYFLPVISSMVAVSVIWFWIYNRDYGLLNSLLSLVGLPRQGWLTSEKWAMPALVVITLWKDLGIDMMILLAGLQDVPEALYDAAKIDGAGRWTCFRHVTLPLMTPSIFLVTILTAIGAFQVFEQTYVLTQGGPHYATLTLGYYIYQQAFQLFRMGAAAALAYVLFAVVLVATLAQFRIQRRWVFYQ
jgi:multiple sugar transport system permease protein